MEHRLKCKTRNYKTIGEHRQNTLLHKSQKILYDPTPKVIETKTKINRQYLVKAFVQ